MNKYIIPSIIALIVFFTTPYLLPLKKEKPKEVVVELYAKVLNNDSFQLFYLKEGQTGFSEEESSRVLIKGSADFQKINFSIPIDAPIKKIRLDLGQNVEQSPITIKTIKIKSLGKSFSYNAISSFDRNVFINYEKGQFITRVEKGRYDPYFVSNFDLTETWKSLSKEELKISKTTIYFLSILAAFIFFTLFYYININIKKLAANAYVFSFFIILLIPSIITIFNINISTEINEKRELAERPKLELTKEFPQSFENYYNENFGARPLLVQLNSRIKTDFFNVSPNPELVQFGADDFLFYNKKNDAIFPSYTNKNLMDENQLLAVFEKHKNLKNRFAEKGITYVFGFFPNKHTIYKELLPFSMRIQKQQQKSLADQIVSYFENKNLSIIDVREDLLKAKNDHQLYYKLDTHWNSFGSFIGYQSFCQQTSSELGLTPYNLDDFHITYQENRTGDLTNMMGVGKTTSYFDSVPVFTLKDSSNNYKITSSHNYPKRTIVTTNEACGNNTTVLVFRDSFSSSFIQFLSLHYYKVIYIWSNIIDESIIEKANPTIIMNLSVERFLPFL